MPGSLVVLAIATPASAATRPNPGTAVAAQSLADQTDIGAEQPATPTTVGADEAVVRPSGEVDDCCSDRCSR